MRSSASRAVVSPIYLRDYKDSRTQVASVRTTRNRWFAFPPLDDGKRWKTLDNAKLVLVSAVDDPAEPKNVDVYLFPAGEERKAF